MASVSSEGEQKTLEQNVINLKKSKIMDENKPNINYADLVFSVVSVKSSNISGIAYRESEGILSVSFLNGTRYVYIDVEKEHYKDFQEASSVGSYFHGNIKGKYDYVKVE